MRRSLNRFKSHISIKDITSNFPYLNLDKDKNFESSNIDIDNINNAVTPKDLFYYLYATVDTKKEIVYLESKSYFLILYSNLNVNILPETFKYMLKQTYKLNIDEFNKNIDHTRTMVKACTKINYKDLVFVNMYNKRFYRNLDFIITNDFFGITIENELFSTYKNFKEYDIINELSRFFPTNIIVKNMFCHINRNDMYDFLSTNKFKISNLIKFLRPLAIECDKNMFILDPNNNRKNNKIYGQFLLNGPANFAMDISNNKIKIYYVDDIFHMYVEEKTIL